MIETAGKPLSKKHTLILDNRQSLIMTGVTDVIGFDDQTVNVKTELGALIIKGASLHITKLNLDSGEVSIEGTINALQYLSSGGKQTGGMLSKLLK